MTVTVEPGCDLAAWSVEHRVRFVRKDRSRSMRVLGWLFGLVGYDFMRRAWTTVGRTVYYPVGGPATATLATLELAVSCTYLEDRRSVVEHEFYHVLQYERLWHLHSLLYLLGMPLPVGLAWYRWWSERAAYLHQVRHYGRSAESVVRVLWRVYGWCWPRWLMRRWFGRRREEDRA